MPAEHTRRTDIIGVINQSPLSAFQWRLFALLFCVALCDGFDTQCIAFVAPAIAKDWSLSRAALGALFSAGFAGTAAGSVLFGVLSDRIGRRLPLIASILEFALATGACATARSYETLFLFRLLAGVGLGGALSCALPLASEYAPDRLKATVVAGCMWGFPMGAFLGGLTAGDMIASYGWASIFWAGAIVPLLLIPAMWAQIPESIRSLSLGGANNGAAIAELLRRIAPGQSFSDQDQFELAEPVAERGATLALFRDGLAPGTLLLWGACFFSCLLIYCLINWIPMVLTEAGLSLRTSAFAAGVLNFAGVAGSYVASRLMKRRPARTIAAFYVVSALAVAAVGLLGHQAPSALATIALAGFFAIGGQISLTAFGTNFYPTPLRSTGTGWLQAVAKIGSIAGPMIGGAILSATGEPTRLFLILALPALGAGLAMAALAVRTRTLESQELPNPTLAAFDRPIAS